MTRLYSHFTIAVKPAELPEFERKLQKIKDSFGIESTSTVFQKMADEWQTFSGKLRNMTS